MYTHCSLRCTTGDVTCCWEERKGSQADVYTSPQRSSKSTLQSRCNVTPPLMSCLSSDRLAACKSSRTADVASLHVCSPALTSTCQQLQLAGSQLFPQQPQTKLSDLRAGVTGTCVTSLTEQPQSVEPSKVSEATTHNINT